MYVGAIDLAASSKERGGELRECLERGSERQGMYL
jgi:hypothetical protein